MKSLRSNGKETSQDLEWEHEILILKDKILGKKNQKKRSICLKAFSLLFGASK